MWLCCLVFEGRSRFYIYLATSSHPGGKKLWDEDDEDDDEKEERREEEKGGFFRKADGRQTDRPTDRKRTSFLH